jgi:hypothetical protein
MDDVALECAVTVPGSWIAAVTQRTYAELQSVLRLTVDELLDRVDWPDPITNDTVIVGTGVESYDLPEAYKRLTFDDYAVYETTRTRRSAIPVTSNGAWTALKLYGSAGGERFYRLSGDESAGFDISFYRPLETGASITVSYVAQNWLRSGGNPASTWATVDDTLLLPDELIRPGCVWRFKKRKGFPYQDIMNEYEAKLARLANESRGKRTICFSDKEPGLPMRVPVPDVIPTA